MSITEVTIWVSPNDDTMCEDIQDVISGNMGVAEFKGLAPDGTEVTVRFLQSVDEDEGDDHRDELDDPYPRDIPEDARDSGLDMPSYGD